MACRHWLDAELGLVRPRVAVALGATAGAALLGAGFRVADHQGKPEQAEVGPWTGVLVSTVHPSAVLRAPEAEARDRAYAGLVADLTAARQAAA